MRDIYKSNIDQSVIYGSANVPPVSVKIEPYAMVGKNVTIGKDTVIHTGAKIGDNVHIGERCVIGANCVIGHLGFKYEGFGVNRKRVDFQWGVIIEDDVEIDGLCNVHPGHFGPTILETGVKLDALVHIAHDCKIGANTTVAAGTHFGGVVTVGRDCSFGLGCCTRPRVKIPANTRCGAGAVIVSDFAEEGLTIAGNPAEPLGELIGKRRLVAQMRRGMNA